MKYHPTINSWKTEQLYKDILSMFWVILVMLLWWYMIWNSIQKRDNAIEYTNIINNMTTEQKEDLEKQIQELTEKWELEVDEDDTEEEIELKMLIKQYQQINDEYTKVFNRIDQLNERYK